MFPGGPNPSKLQSAPGTTNLPLVLIHDGGGTSFAYFLLGELKRDVWAIHDPNYWEGKTWPGGMDEMARHYIVLMRNAGIRGKILLGGWSLGGLLSMTIARLLADDPTALLTVSGTILIDTPYHVPNAETGVRDPDMSNLPKLIQKSFQNCDIYLEHWRVPTFSGPAHGGKPVRLRGLPGEPELQRGQYLHMPVKGEGEVKQGQTYEFNEFPEKPLAPPPGVLLRGLRRAETKSGQTEECTIDMFRDDELLGWGGRYPDFIKATYDIDSAHFDIFDKLNERKLEIVTDRIRQGVELLDMLCKSGQ
ncbi:Alpha/Beta hydrolase protein [Emericellopsis atlantica]|uniref:Alpha/Beta hydrolase protein n=1 Tax=Emericellopsis atlantica TaxID=2614577 RepID=A0A9P7ZEK2_9HYPO|nr:Alpha/Beta hydrolase protein [Emericellopsis atlantica]KAG9250296.1 Alpha/Beta hydrolase protein [Emericellopsis atlantica]